MALVKTTNKERRKKRVRAKVSGTAERPRLSVYRSNKAMHVQLIDDISGKTLVGKVYKSDKGSISLEEAKKAGADLAKEAKSKKIETVVFDRNGFKYAGRVRALADSAREAGLKF